ncbi:hypothetical protein AALA54_04135 [Oscillospiraceae bacterium 44-34]
MRYNRQFFYDHCGFSEVRRISQVNVKACSNREELVYTPDYVDHEKHRQAPRTYRLSNGWGETVVQPESAPVHATLYVYQDADMPELEFFWEGDEYFLAGPVLERDRMAPDRRYTVYSTGGVLTRIMPGILEKEGFSCLHATSVYSPEKNHMMVFVGGPGAGKTILMLEATLRRGFRLMTTEYTHFRTTGDGVEFYTGSVFDNVRAGNLLYNYTEYEKIWGKEIMDTLPTGVDPWNAKVSLDMTPLLPDSGVIRNPRVSLVFVKIEGQRDAAVVTKLDRDATRFQLYLNAAELISRPRLFFGCMPVPSLDTTERAWNRLKIVDNMLNTVELVECISLFAGVNNAWIWNE